MMVGKLHITFKRIKSEPYLMPYIQVNFKMDQRPKHKVLNSKMFRRKQKVKVSDIFGFRKAFLEWHQKHSQQGKNRQTGLHQN